jgi:hypothetical protein
MEKYINKLVQHHFIQRHEMKAFIKVGKKIVEVSYNIITKKVSIVNRDVIKYCYCKSHLKDQFFHCWKGDNQYKSIRRNSKLKGIINDINKIILTDVNMCVREIKEKISLIY